MTIIKSSTKRLTVNLPMGKAMLKGKRSLTKALLAERKLDSDFILPGK